MNLSAVLANEAYRQRMLVSARIGVEQNYIFCRISIQNPTRTRLGVDPARESHNVFHAALRFITRARQMIEADPQSGHLSNRSTIASQLQQKPAADSLMLFP
jgi:hypothetical protein